MDTRIGRPPREDEGVLAHLERLRLMAQPKPTLPGDDEDDEDEEVTDELID